jgi:hypothetical protein
MARFLSHTPAARPRPNASSPISLQIAPQGLNNYSGGMTSSKCAMRHARDAALQTAQIAGNQLVNG